MRGINKVIRVGNLGKDPEKTVFENNNCVVKFTLATSESYRDDKGETHTSTKWHNIVVWGSLAIVADNYLKKGSYVYIEGKLKTRTFETTAGEKKYVTKVIANTLLMLDKKQ
jgi:single-strand DNA-binding protein